MLAFILFKFSSSCLFLSSSDESLDVCCIFWGRGGGGDWSLVGGEPKISEGRLKVSPEVVSI